MVTEVDHRLGFKLTTCIPYVEGILPKGPTRHAYAWQIGPFWQDTLDVMYEVFDVNILEEIDHVVMGLVYDIAENPAMIVMDMV